MEMPGFEPGASYMQSMRSTTELHPLEIFVKQQHFSPIFFISHATLCHSSVQKFRELLNISETCIVSNEEASHVLLGMPSHARSRRAFEFQRQT